MTPLHLTRFFRRLCLLVLLLPMPLAAALPVPAPPSFEASSYLLMDFESGQLLSELDPDAQVEPASITKLMTAYLVYGALASGQIAMDDQVLVSEKAWRTYGSRMFIEVDTRVSVEDLLRGMIVQSGNDATVALAEHVAGSESAFVDMMNAQAQALGMSQTQYRNSSGLPDAGHYTSARDIATLARALIRDYPDYYPLYSEREYSYNGIQQFNRNRLLWRDESVDGLKTGHTESAGYCLVASAEREGMRLISVVLGTESENARARHSQSLLNYGFRFFETHKLYAADESLTDARVWKGEAPQVALGLAEDLYVTIPRGRYERLQASMELTPAVEAPVARGAALGDVVVTLDGEQVATAPLVALQEVQQGGIARRAIDSVMRWFE